MKIPFVNLTRMHDPLRGEIDTVIKEIIDTNNYINGKAIFNFETHFAKFTGVQSVIGMSSGTDALFLALKAFGIGEGDYVITVPNTFIATTEAISMTGSKILFVDIDETSSNMCPDKLEDLLKKTEKSLLSKIKAIIFVNLYGNPQGLDQVFEISRKYNIPLISDAAQAHGAQIDNKPITDFADITAYSFFPGKNLGAFGDAGGLAVNDPELAKKLNMLRNHGRIDKYLHTLEGYNCRIDTLQAAILDVKLKSLNDWNNNRINSAKLYNSLLKEKNIIVQELTDKYKHVFHLYVIRINEREKMIEKLNAAGVSTGIHYPLPLHLQPAYSQMNLKEGDFPVSEKLSTEILSLPIDGAITPEEVEYVCSLM